MRRIFLALALLWLAGSACSLSQATSSAASGVRTSPAGTPLALASGALDAEVAMPPGFPSDFPVYPRARLTAAAPFTSTGQTAWGMEWETVDPQAKVADFYTKQLSQGDWVLTGTSTPNGEFAGTFSRKSDKNVQGTVGADRNGSVTKILVSLVYST